MEMESGQDVETRLSGSIGGDWDRLDEIGRGAVETPGSLEAEWGA